MDLLLAALIFTVAPFGQSTKSAAAANATLTAENMLQTAEHSKSRRLYLATFAVAPAFNHYGQTVEYLRMKGIVPPASRGKTD